MTDYVFKEEQRFDQWWLWLPFMTLYAIVSYAMITAVTDLDDRSNAAYISSLIVINAVALLLYMARIKSRIDPTGISFRFSPFHRRQKHFLLSEIQEIEMVKYRSLMQFGGWGIRYNSGKWLYNVRGNNGIRVKTAKTHFILGTQKPKEAKRAVEQIQTRLKGSHAR